jgi:hypothetical protein
MLQVNQLIGFGAGGLPPASIGIVTAFETSADNTVYTFPGVSFGAAAPNRYIAIAAGSRSGNDSGVITGITIGGVAGTQIANIGNTAGGGSGVSNAAIFLAHVPTGTTGDVVVTHASGAVRCAIAIYRAIGISPVPTDTGTSISSDPSTTLDIAQGGVALAITHNDASGAAATWTGLTEDRDFDVEADTFSSASAAFAAPQNGLTVQCTWVPDGVNAFAAASFPPG